MVLFCTIWSIGAAIDEVSRKNFDKFVRKLITANSEIPEEFGLELFRKFPFVPKSIRA
jgi:dynein heavy chain